MQIKSLKSRNPAGKRRSASPMFFVAFFSSAVCAMPLFAGNAGSFLRAYPLVVPTKQYQVTETTWPLPGGEGYSITMSAAADKFEPATFVLRAGENLSGVTIRSTALVGPGIIPDGNIDIRLVKTWYQASSGNCSCDVGKFLIPEVLVKDDALIATDRAAQKSYLRATIGGRAQYVDITTVGSTVPAGAVIGDSTTLQPFSMAANTNKQVWMTTHIAAGTPAGVYSGTLTISVPGRLDTTLSLSVNVLPFTLAPSLVEQAIYYRARLNDSCASLTPECRTPAQMAAELANLRDHGIQYPTLYERITSAHLALRLALMESAGLPKDKILQLGDSLSLHGVTSLSGLPSLVTQWNNFATSRGWGQVYNYGIDEATGARFDSQAAAFNTIHAHGGKIMSAIPDTTTALRPDMNKIDIAVLYGYGTLSSTVARVHQTTNKVFRYGGPFSDMENPQYVRNHYGFGLLYKDYDGAMNYAYQYVGQLTGDIWNDFKPNAAGERNHAWTYPTSDGVLDTLQWEGYREAVDDIRYASTLALRRGWTKAQLVAYLRGLPTLAENSDSIDAPATRQTIINDILATGSVATRSPIQVNKPALSNPTISLTYEGQLRDRVGQAELALHPDGKLDGVFTVTLGASAGARTITRLHLTNAPGGVWNTQPQDIFWSLGVGHSLDGPLLNRADDSAVFDVSAGSSFKIFAADYHDRMYFAGTVFTLTATFSDGSTASANVTVGPTPSTGPTISLSYDGRLRDRVGQAELALQPDGKLDGVFTVTPSAGADARAITRLQLTNVPGGVWNTEPQDTFWSLGVARALDDALLNAANDSFSLDVSEGGSFKIFAADYHDRMYFGGIVFTLTATFSNGSMASASTTVP